MIRPIIGCLILAAISAALGAGQEPSAKKGDNTLRKPAAPPKKDDAPPAPRDELPPIPPGGKLWLSPEKYRELDERYQKLRDQFHNLERQLKSEPAAPSACKLIGRLDGDVVSLRAEFAFATPIAHSTVFLGLKHGFLVDEGKIDDETPHLEAIDDGYLVRVEKPGPHRLTLNVRIPATARRPVATGPSNERGFDLGLPGSAVTTMSLEMPKGVKDFRWNDVAASPRGPGRWELTLGSLKNLAVVWREPTAAPSASLGPSAKADIKVKLLEGRIEIAGTIFLEDAKNPIRDWHLLLPPQVKVAPAASSAPFEWSPPDGKSNSHRIRIAEPAEKVALSIQAQIARTSGPQKLAIGPLLAQEAPLQGTISIQAAPGILRGQRLIYHRFGEIFQRDPPKSTAGLENIAQFQFWNATFSGKGLSPAKAALELEWKTEKGQIDASAEYDVKIRDDRGQWLIDVDAKFLVQAANSRLDSLEMHAPAASLPEMLWLGTQPSVVFPGALPWPIALTPRPALPLSTTALDDGGSIDATPLDGQQRVRLKLSRPIGNEAAVRVQVRYLAAAGSRFVVDLPRLAGPLDRGAKLVVWAPAGKELFVGSGDRPEPVYEKFQQSLEQMPASIELSWRESRRERLARAVVDLVVREQAIQVRQTLSLPIASWSGGATQTGQIALRLPSANFAFDVANAPRLTQDKGLAWVRLPVETNGSYEFELSYDVPRKKADAAIAIPLLWPDEATNRDAKLRVWTEPGVTPLLRGMGETWQERPLEEGSIPGIWPSMVAAGMGPTLPISLQFENSAGERFPAMVADRSLVQVRIEDDGTQVYRCRFLARKFSGTSLEVEFPGPWEQTQPRVRIAGRDTSGARLVDPVRHRVRIPLAPSLYPSPTLVEIEYQVPPPQGEGRRSWQAPLTPPRFVGDVVFGPTRWAATLPGQQIPVVLGPTAVDYGWTFRGWLFVPEPSVGAGDLDAWIGAEEAPEGDPPGLVWWRSSLAPQRIYYVSRQTWLVGCSGAALLLGMLLLMPTPWTLRIAVLLGLAIGIAILGLYHEYLLPTLFVGCEPGVAVLAAFAAIHALVRERARRQSLNLPSFSRVPLGSTLVRNPPKPPHIPSTIDAPASLAKGSAKSAPI